MQTIGFIGVGKIGLPICDHLIKAGHKVIGYRRSSLADFEKLGGVAAKSPADIGAQADIYQGMIIGEHSRDNDLDVNPLKGKKLTNVRASGTDEAVRLTTPITMTLEQAIAYVDDDELVEVTPNAIRLRKRYLDPHERKRHAKAK